MKSEGGRLERIRLTGIARDRAQLQIGVYSIAAPVLVDGQVGAALSLTAPVERFRQHETDYVAALQDCAAIPQSQRAQSNMG